MSRGPFSDPYKPSDILDSRSKPSEKDDDAEKPTSRARICHTKVTRFMVASVFIAGSIAVMAAVAVMYQKAPNTEDFPKEFHCFLSSNNTIAMNGKLRLNTTMVILCDYSENIKQIVSNSSLLVEFKHDINRIHVQINQTLQLETVLAGRWFIRSSPSIEIRGGPLKCGDVGQLVITLQTPTRSYVDQVEVQIESETSSVQMELSQPEVDEQCKIRCSSTSGCTASSINLLGTMGNQSFPLYGMNFTCITLYNNDDGWSVDCTGSIPNSVVSSLDVITCRPVLQNQTEADKTEAKVSKEGSLSL